MELEDDGDDAFVMTIYVRVNIIFFQGFFFWKNKKTNTFLQFLKKFTFCKFLKFF